MLFVKFGWNWPSGSGKEVKNVTSLQTDRRTTGDLKSLLAKTFLIGHTKLLNCLNITRWLNFMKFYHISSSTVYSFLLLNRRLHSDMSKRRHPTVINPMNTKKKTKPREKQTRTYQSRGMCRVSIHCWLVTLYHEIRQQALIRYIKHSLLLYDMLDHLPVCF